ncbi:M56 family metallopeptidase [Cohnella sp. REN36]|uniref:M56 family metallopeptidase n=1 Tax=Cohnella sp. REN36 TaxID=2887347 RepID=UPI001D1443ED|nr:M56 family metallopeptidase [Cohnella sp. REN36]MCC3372434.1 M56 family metallopeptidase [Cohnella sp. REN36]
MQSLFYTLLQDSVSMSLVTLAYAAVWPLLSKRYAAQWCYRGWMLIAAGWAIPFRPRIDLLNIPVQMPDPLMNAMPSMTVTDGTNASASIPIWSVLATIWVAGVVCIASYQILRHRSLVRAVRRWSTPVADSKVLETLDNLKSELNMRKHIGLSECRMIASPMLVGFFRPTILLPPISFSDEQLSLILKHELIHFKRHDLWFKAIVLLATVFHWFNPIVYWMSKSIAVQCEFSCDALVLQGADFQQRKQYGEAIIAVARNGAKLRTAFSTQLYGGKRSMKNRISFIMDTKRKKAGVIILWMALSGTIMTGAAVAAGTDENPQPSIRLPEVVVAAPDSDSDKDPEVFGLMLLLRSYSHRTNANDPQPSARRPEVVVAAPNSDSDSDKDPEVSSLLKLLRSLEQERKRP